MDSNQFETYFSEYLGQAQHARQQNQHHDFRRQLFLSFLQKAFSIEQSDIEIEKYISLTNRQIPAKGLARIRKGWIDAIFQDLIFEFKRDLKKEEAEGLRELNDYLSNIPNGSDCVGLLTDGIIFIAYILDSSQSNGLRQINMINLEAVSPRAAYLWLDAYLLRQSNIPPTSADIVQRFGLISPTFVTAARILSQALHTFSVSKSGAFEVKRQQWAFHLARVYGSVDISNDELFIRHTYLCQFAKILAFAAQFGIEDTYKQIESIIDGKAFEILGVNNIGEQDFFSWVLAPEVRQQTLRVFHHIAESLVVYNLSRIDEDLLKQLYQNLVDPETRHDLGEFYTPDWLAELTLREIDYQPGQSLLDPACGSGTFLFTAIRYLADKQIRGEELVDFALDNIMGLDVHPLAVTIAKINYMLAILPHLQNSKKRGQRAIPIAMANALQVPIKSHQIEVIPVQINEERTFLIPVGAARHPNELNEVLSEMGRYAIRMAATPNEAKYSEFGTFAISKLPAANTLQTENERIAWNTNVRLLTKQITEGRDSIWIYLLQNTSRPLFLRHHQFDVVIGNPPWISYRYIQDPTYQKEIKKLAQEYGLHDARKVKLNTQMELAALFFEHCQKAYRKAGGTIAFVMPRSVITGAKQHAQFQQKGVSRILDLKEVVPLFNVETCVIFRKGPVVTENIPTTRFSGILPAHECTLTVARTVLTSTVSVTNFTDQELIASPYYYPRFKQGATLVPRNLTFVTSAQPNLKLGQLAYSTIMKTDPDANEEAKEPWKNKKWQGHIDTDFLYATLLSKYLMPFGIRKFHLTALPVRVGVLKQIIAVPGQSQETSFIPMTLEAMRDTFTFARSADDWFKHVENLWKQYRKSTSMELWDRLNYQQGIRGQSATPGFLVLYGATGSNISACVIDTHELPIINGIQPKAFVVDHKTYWYRSNTKEESHFLAALLNAPSVDSAIKTRQTRGIYKGPRDIHRRPFEVCTIPQFDPHNVLHQQLAALSLAAHTIVTTLDLQEGGVVAARKQARMAVSAYINQIDKIAQKLLGLEPSVENVADNRDDEDLPDEDAG